jgi:hypothetical protein
LHNSLRPVLAGIILLIIRIVIIITTEFMDTLYVLDVKMN